MSSVQYHAVVAFGLISDGFLAPILERAAVDRGDAIRLAKLLARDHAGVVAFSRMVDLGRAHYGPANVHVIIGQLPEDLAAMFSPQLLRCPVRREAQARKDMKSPKSAQSVVIRPALWAR